MVSQSDDSPQRVALFLVFGLIAIVVASVLVFAVKHRGAPAQAVAPAAGVAIAPAMPADASIAMAQAASDAASVKVEQGIVKFYFASGKADLAAGASEALTDVVKGAQAGRKVAISGFHDATGDADQNAELAKQRALAVRDALTTAGVPESQIELNKPEPIASSATGSDAEARRVEISLQ
ncbi:MULTISPECIES: OmpA family protein [unclassified Polaromonas]|uniref:OmpA family protein n=1 Tax=unclassified Polaromonas TaxID=2638319 RepID=UPI0018CA3785|nr:MULTISPECIES: OmpA family protein [unclassified Polaromonas]MBG6071055.1 outer membrane protein OmpA-like peptidoglycan-associated protein [Polaromonas sp. CG_9.7]MBG6113055.1 outer membrane protein OmpA-like peptidoglycan-associated protein [Polaromonas sp. CG_9.2]MDH6185587.1 outer membrane protein OmpA-like peptidoglycan-associated protein [Polaromonas sp. CG_23.6]